ncbi:AfsR/SARP family transcriptional regulator [Lentzea flava]|uniref:XRE family transcriptional regulator n=1 Tax=Lentzea flava TaxID=103732 RepID=A0ABQ2UI88_9PSEU|nr:tetratricopeptide repeat protein [Lentzea flava]MCP2198939.1 DNA-binding transcriptional activator of the SARP family [Lentzea flava]GGU32787.1 XRE family transcriptional regulator [Lentzea flava]
MTMPDAPMAFRLLGDVEVSVGGQRLEIGPPQQRTVLACLAIEACRPVSLQTLGDRLWGQDQPGGARASLHAHLTRIRQILAAGATAAGADVRLERRTGGYVLEVDRDWVDLHRFRRLARAPCATDAERVTSLRSALDLWRGRPLAGTSGSWAVRISDTLVKEHLDAVTLWADALTHLGRAGEVIGPVREVVTEHPLAEPLVAVLMRALALCGRDAEALELFTSARLRLADELGIDPGPELRTVHEALLRGEIRHTAETPEQNPVVEVPPQPARRVPAQLPADVYAFTGREHELSTLDKMLVEADGTSTAVVVSAVSGTAGVGKTSLVLRWAHRVRDRFPDGQLYVDLRGYDAERPLTAADALTRFLSALGLGGRDIPLDVEDRAARYRTELSGQRMLILLDNAATVDQVRQLLPGTPGCLVLVTSRDSLAGLVARHGARRLDLDLLPLPDAVQLLGRLIGQRVTAEPDAARTLAEECARLPLALRVAAELAAARPSTPLSVLVEELADQQMRLDLLDADLDPRTAVRAVFSWSYQNLAQDAAAMFRLLGLHPGQDFDAHAVAALGGIGLQQARQLLDRLARVHLVQAQRHNRYGMHDLLRAYAGDLAGALDPASDRRAAITRLFDFYLSTAAAAMDTLHPAERHRRPQVEVLPTPAPVFATTKSAQDWLNDERANLVAVCVHAEAHEWPAHAVNMANTLFRYFDASGLNTEAFKIHSLGRQAAVRIGDHGGEARALVNLGLVYWHQGLLDQAEEHLRLALGRYADVHDDIGRACAHKNLGVVLWRRGDLEEATGHLTDALVIYRRLDDVLGQAEALGNLGLVHQSLDQLDLALAHHRQALDLFEGIGYRVGEAYALNDLGIVHLRSGQPAEAVEKLGRALDHFRRIGERAGETEALNGLGQALCAAGLLDDAEARHTEALAVAGTIDDRFEQARAHAGLAAVREAVGDLERARAHRETALAGYTSLGVPEADAVRALLARADEPEDQKVGW